MFVLRSLKKIVIEYDSKIFFTISNLLFWQKLFENLDSLIFKDTHKLGRSNSSFPYEDRCLLSLTFELGGIFQLRKFTPYGEYFH